MPYCRQQFAATVMNRFHQTVPKDAYPNEESHREAESGGAAPVLSHSRPSSALLLVENRRAESHRCYGLTSRIAVPPSNGCGSGAAAASTEGRFGGVRDVESAPRVASADHGERTGRSAPTAQPPSGRPDGTGLRRQAARRRT